MTRARPCPHGPGRSRRGRVPARLAGIILAAAVLAPDLAAWPPAAAAVPGPAAVSCAGPGGITGQPCGWFYLAPAPVPSATPGPSRPRGRPSVTRAPWPAGPLAAAALASAAVGAAVRLRRRRRRNRAAPVPARTASAPPPRPCLPAVPAVPARPAEPGSPAGRARGTGLAGPGAAGAARAVLAARLAATAGPEAVPAVIATAGTWQLLCPGAPAVPGLAVAASLEAALDQMEAAVLGAARARPGPGPAPQGTGPAVTLVAEPGPGQAARLAAILTAAGGLAGAVILGDWTAGITLTLAADGTVTAVTPPGAPRPAGQLPVLDASQAAGRILAGRPARQAARPVPGTAARVPQARAAPAPGAPARESRPREPAPGTETPAVPQPPAAAAPGPAAPPPAGRAAVTAGPAPAPVSGRLVRVEVLGPLRITAGGREISGGLRKARELLAYLAVNPGGAAQEVLEEALWPGAGPEQATAHRNLALRKARLMLRSATRRHPPMWILHTSGRYTLDSSVISTDVADFDREARLAVEAGDPQETAARWRAAVALYRGETADGAGYDWAGPYAETARRRALDAWTRLAGILQQSDPDQALAVLETALSHDVHNEPLVQRIMQLHAAAGRPDAAARVLRELEARLAEISAVPGPQTRQVAAALLGPARGGSGGPRAGTGPPAGRPRP